MGGCLCCCCPPAGDRLSTWDVNPNVRLDKKMVILTGADNAVGMQTAIEMARRGARLVLGCHTAASGKEVVAAITHAAEDEDFPFKARDAMVIPLDLGDLTTVYAFVEAFAGTGKHCDLLINNDVIASMEPKHNTKDGFEVHIGINHLGHFALTTELINRGLMAEEGARIINLSSGAHRAPGADLHFDDLIFTHRRFDSGAAFLKSKLANILFTRELYNRYSDKYVVAAVNPGVQEKELASYCGCCASCCLCCCYKTNKTPEQGAATTVWAATADADTITSHEYLYFAHCGPEEPGWRGKRMQDAAALWTASEKLINDASAKPGKSGKKKAFVGSGSGSGSGSASASDSSAGSS